MRNRLRRIWRWWPVLPVLFLALLTYLAWPARWTVTVSPETTYVTEPLDAQGFVDYPTALNQRLAAGITPESNANVLIWQALGPHPEGGTMPPEYFQWLRAPAPPEQGEYFLTWDKYFQAHLPVPPAEPAEEAPPGPPGQVVPPPPPPPLPPGHPWKQQWDERVERAQKWPWKAADEPEIADWLKRNEKPLALAVEASKRPRYFNPLVSKVDGQNARLISSLLPSVQLCRQVAAALKCRAMGRLAGGDLDGAWQDLMACQRLGRLLGGGACLIEGLVGIAIITIASDGQLTLLSEGKPSARQVRAWLEDLHKLPPFPPVADKLDLGERFMTLDALMSIVYHGPRFADKLGNSPGAAGPPRPEAMDRVLSQSIDFDPAFRNANRMFDRCVAAARLPDRAARMAELGKIEADIRQMRADVEGVNPLDRAVMSKAARGESIGNLLLSLMLPALQKMFDAQDRADQTMRNLNVAFALAAYRADAGRYPERLDELAPKYLPTVPGDLFSGKPLVYRPDEAGYLLYSVGLNGVDDDGHWTDDDPKGDDLRVRMPVPEPRPKE